MVTDRQVRRLMKLLQSEETLAAAAIKSGMDEKTARKYRRLGKPPSELKVEHIWRTRQDPFAEVWVEVKAKLELNAGLEAKTLFGNLQRRYPDRFADGQLRSFQRAIREWKLGKMLETNRHEYIRTAHRLYGKSIRKIQRATGHSRNTIRKVLREEPYGYAKREHQPYPVLGPYLGIIDRWLEQDKERPKKERHTARGIYRRLVEEYSFQGSETTVRRYVREARIRVGITAPKKEKTSSLDPRFSVEAASIWMLEILQGAKSLEILSIELMDTMHLDFLLAHLTKGGLRDRNKALTIIARRKGIRNSVIAKLLHLSPKTTQRYYNTFVRYGPSELFAKARNAARKVDDPKYGEAVFSILHSPPSIYGINRTSWKMDDLHRTLAAKGVRISRQSIRSIIKKAGYRWRKAQRVLTSKDPKYQEKVEKIKSILADIDPTERFFSIDEFGPFHITKKSGRKLVAPGEHYTIPQRQKSKGKLIVTAALELCTNQITHFFSERKNTNEMILLLDVLLAEYVGMEKLYLSWDAASWHLSRKFYQKVEEVNARRQVTVGIPEVELAPLPSGAQFLNVIESIFSGMARAIIHNSDYQSEEHAMRAIDRYFEERNSYFRANPKRAGQKIWGKERVKPLFSESNNCKDPRWS
jgi:transposase